jgi:hypothetical protein
MRRTVAAYEQFSNFREPLRDGAPKAIIPKRLSSTTFLSTIFFCEQRKDATRGSPQGDTFPAIFLPKRLHSWAPSPPTTIKYFLLARAIKAAHGVRSFSQAEKEAK